MNPPNLLFVNKTATSESLSHSSSKAGTRIYSHVQRNRRWKDSDHGIVHARRLIEIQSQPRHASPKSHEECNTATEPDEEPGKGSECQPFDQVKLVQATEEHSSILTGRAQLGTQTSGYLGFKALSSISTIPQSAEDIIDPFNTTCIVVDRTAHTLLQYYLRTVHPSVWHILCADSNGSASIFKDKAMSVLQGALSNTYDMYCLLASMNVHMRYLDGCESGRDNDFFIVKAVKASHDYMRRAERISEKMIFNVFQLGFAEWYRNNQHAALVHFRATTNMTYSIGGLRALARPVADLLVLGDGYIAGELGTLPYFSHTEFARQEDPDSAMGAYVLETLQTMLSGSIATARGLLQNGRKELVPRNMDLMIMDLAVVVSVMNAADAGGTPQDLADSALHWIYHRVLVIRHQLLEVKFDDARTESIRIAILLWILQCFTRAGRIRSTKIIAPQLRKSLQETTESTWKGHNEVRLWILMVGATSARTGSGDHAWFLQQILRSMALASTSDELAVKNGLVQLCGKFFYREFIQGEMLEKLAGNLVSMRRKADTTATRPQNRSVSLG